jgi:hypothetical protein
MFDAPAECWFVDSLVKVFRRPDRHGQVGEGSIPGGAKCASASTGAATTRPVGDLYVDALL